MAKDGIGLVTGIAVAAIVFSIIGFSADSPMAWVFAGLGLLTMFFVINFFRDPERSIPTREGIIVSPGDGKVLAVSEVEENSFLRSRAHKISIFLSVFDVHVNRIPMSGRIEYFDYVRGEFKQAFRPEASLVNEHTVIGIQNGNAKVVFKQIAGILARRIVCNIREGNSVRMGERFGMIKFGSRIDVLVPLDAEIRVELNQKVKGGESILAELSSC
jgi:phosphatidylserine decarboxylase